MLHTLVEVVLLVGITTSGLSTLLTVGRLVLALGLVLLVSKGASGLLDEIHCDVVWWY